jgi:acyl carrier protein
MKQDISLAVRRFIVENFVFRVDAEVIVDDQSLLDAGIIDSTGVLELVSFLETTFGIEVQDDEMLPENLDCIRAIVKFVAGKVASSQAGPLAEPEQLAA